VAKLGKKADHDSKAKKKSEKEYFAEVHELKTASQRYLFSC
jgi:hypothetical protein